MGEGIGLHPDGYNLAWGEWIEAEGAGASSEDVTNQMYILKAMFGY